MSKTTANISIDADVKAQAQALFADLGLDLSTAVNIFLRQSIRENAIPFSIYRDSPNDITLSAMVCAEEGNNIYGPYDSTEELMEALNA